MEFDNYDSILSSIQDETLKDQTIALSDIAIKTEPNAFLSPYGSSLSPSYSSGSSPEEFLFNPEYMNNALWDLPELTKQPTSGTSGFDASMANTASNGSNGSLSDSTGAVAAVKNEPTRGKGKKIKSSHNLVEKKYRTNINSKIVELRNSVPALRIIISKNMRNNSVSSQDQNEDEDYDDYEGYGYTDDESKLDGLKPAKKLNKATILSKATEYIRHLEWKNSLLQDEVKRLKNDLESSSRDILQSIDPSQGTRPRHNQSQGLNNPAANGTSLTNKLLLGGMACYIGSSAFDDFDGSESSYSRHGLFALPILSIGDSASTQTNLLKPMFGILKMLFVMGVVWFYVLLPLISEPRPKNGNARFVQLYRLVASSDPIVRFINLSKIKNQYWVQIFGPSIWNALPRDRFSENEAYLLDNYRFADVAGLLPLVAESETGTEFFKKLAQLKSQEVFNSSIKDMTNSYHSTVPRAQVLSELIDSIQLLDHNSDNYVKHLIKCSILSSIASPSKEGLFKCFKLVQANPDQIDQSMVLCLMCSIVNFHFRLTHNSALAMKWFEKLNIPHYTENFKMDPMGFVSLLYIVDDIPIEREGDLRPTNSEEESATEDTSDEYTLSRNNFKMLNILGNMRIFIGNRSDQDCDLKVKNQMVESFVSKLEMLNGF
ncbi:unnamed protein product [Kuraishia capsulata CBS 1993]|uniref:BHLH domain-containing protein n=1 Tax=Kuraishia capsulata CBS 1993 TaxID=1382522 RepID=W6ML42_9ASCO|nr:uncharacterized protein KUCA_T00002787001 [Kuraishia capsulata CBS 1993]CDK26813.1 unnamed protein product [Kuraishia capsulata CBS 1993]